MSLHARASYEKLISRAIALAVALSVVLVVLKLFAWLITDSVSMFASLADSTLDFSASLINLVAVRYSLKPADDSHHFGHGKLESLVALVQAVIIGASAVFVLYSAVERLYLRILPEPNLFGLLIMLVSMALTSLLVYYQHRVVQKTQSQAVRADAAHYRADLLGGVAVLIALASMYLGVHWVDPAVSLLIVGVLLYSVKTITIDAINTLMDSSLPVDELQFIHEKAEEPPQVLGIHELRVRRSGKTRFIQFHIELADEMPLVEAHAICDTIEDEIKKRFVDADILIHPDPISVVGKEH